MKLSLKQVSCLKKILKAINKWRIAGQSNQENSETALSLGVKAMESVTKNLELLTDCLDKHGGSLKTKNILNQHFAMVEGMRINNDLDFENMGGYYDYQSFAQDYFTSDIEKWIEHLAGIPEDLIILEIAVADYLISRATLKRWITAGKIKSYRPENSPKNAKHIVSRTEIEQYCPKKTR